MKYSPIVATFPLDAAVVNSLFKVKGLYSDLEFNKSKMENYVPPVARVEADSNYEFDHGHLQQKSGIRENRNYHFPTDWTEVDRSEFGDEGKSVIDKAKDTLNEGANYARNAVNVAGDYIKEKYDNL